MDKKGGNKRDNKKEAVDLFKENWLSFVLAIAGLILVMIGVGFMVKEGGVESGQEVRVEEEAEGEEVVVDIEGAVLKPGVYKLPFGSRIRDLLIAAGGLSEGADRDWVAKNLNQALRLKDGEKIYIPRKGEGRVGGSSWQVGGRVNINTASLSELDALPGIGQARGQKIIDGRPYLRIEELLEKKVVPASVFEKIRNKISVY